MGDEGQGTNVGGAGVNDTDRVEVYGTAQNAGALRLNNIALPQVVTFAGVTNLNVNTFDLDDDVVIDPFASTTQSWNLVVNVNTGAGDDDVVYGNANVVPVADPVPNGSVAAVSENITVTPTLTPGAGEIAVPGVVTIHFQETEDLSFLLNNGVAGDSDTLTILGTDSNLSDVFTIRPDAAGNDLEPVVDLDISAVQMLQIENIAAVALGGAQFFVTALTFAGLGGSDIFNLLPSASGTILNIDGGNPTNNPLASDIIEILATSNVADQFTVTAGATADSGAIASTINGTPRAAVSFTNLEGITINMGEGAAADALTMQGTGASNAFTVVATGISSGTARVDAGPLVTFNGLGSAGTDLSLVGLGGDDQFSVTHLADWLVDDVNIDGGDPSASDAFQLSGTAGIDGFVYTANSANSGQIDLTSGGATTNYILTSVESALVDGLAAIDTLSVPTPNAVIMPGANPGEGTVRPIDNVGAPLLPLAYRSIETVSVTGATAVIQGTEENDTITVSATGIVTVTNNLGFNSSVNVSGFNSIVINSNGGDDTITIAPSALFAGGIRVIGGSNGNGSDSLSLSGADLVVDLEANSVSGVVGGPVSFTGIEHLNVTAAATILINGKSSADQLSVTPTGANTTTIVPSAGGLLSINTNNPGSLTINTVSGSDAITVNGTPSNDTIGVARTAVSQVSVGALKVVQVSNSESLRVVGGDGNDTINVTGTGSTAFLVVDGGLNTANDTVTVTNLTAGTTTYTPGSTSDSGTLGTPDGGIQLLGTELITLTGAAATDTLTANGTHGNDTIALQFLGGANRIWLNGQSVISLSSYGTVNLNGRFGDDKINVLPIGLVGVTTVNVNGGDPTASDELVVSGSAGNDTINYNVSNTVGAGSVAITGAPVVNFVTTESLHIDGQGGSDALTVTSPSGQRTTVTPGSAADSGTIRSQGFGAGTASVPLSYAHIGALGTVTIVGVGNIVEFNGTANSDTFSVTGTTAQIFNATNGFVTNLFTLTNVFALELRGLDGDDTFNLSGSIAPFTGGVVVDGSNPSASDVLNLNAPTGAVAVNLGATSTVNGYGAAVTMIGVETLNASAGNNNLTVNGTTGDDSLEVTPTGANNATFRLTKSSPAVGSTPVVNGSQIGTLSVDLQGGNDVLTVNGTTAGEAITVTTGLVTVGTHETVNFAGVEALSVYAHQGADTITVTPGGIPIFIDGGDPIGVMPGDQLIVNAAVGFFAGPENDEGGVLTGGSPVSFDHIESLTVAAIAGCPFLILGTNADDDITVIARDASTTAGADGVQDFTFSINQGPSVVVLNQTDLYIDAMAGDDDIVIRASAPNEAPWDVNVRVAGGSPSIGAPAEADRLVLETPNNAGGFDDVIFNPTGADTGNMVIDENANGVYDAGGTDSIITFGSFIFDCQPAAFTYTSTAGGVELIQYNGEGAPAVDDNLTINGTALDDTTILNPTGVGTGSFASGASPQFIFKSFDSVTVNSGTGGFDRVQVDGTEGPDTVTSNATTVTLGGLVTIGTGIDQLDINTFGGNDNVDLDLAVPGLAKFINVGGGNDIVNLLGLAVDPADPTIYGGDGDDFIIGSPNPDSIFGGTGNDILVGAGGVDQIYGEEGNDILGNPSAVANGVADDAGNDFLHGGADSDLFIWEPGDGSDIIEGGAGDADVLAFFGGAGAEVFNVLAKVSDPARAILFRNTGNITIDMAGVDQINVQGNAGADSYVVGRANNGDSGSVAAPTSPYTDPTASLSDLSTTEVRVVNIVEAVDAPDNVFVDGRPTDDNLTVTVESALTGVLRVAGLPYDVRISGTTTADRLTIRGNEGNDSIKAINSSNATVEGLIGITFAGGAGHDTLSADAILIGGNGDDFLEGGAGADQLFGNDGEDTMVGGAGNDTFDGGAGFDTILVRGTLGNDAIDISQTADVTLVETVNGVAETDTLVLNAGTRTVERVLVEASAGNDTIRVQWADSLGTDANVNSLRVDVNGGPGTTADRLGVVDLGTGDLILFEAGTTADSGAMAVGPGNAEPLIVNFTNIEVAQPVAGVGGDVVFFKHDDFEYNDARTLATYLGSGDAINVDPNINPGLDPIFGLPGDEDWFRVVAERTGVLDFQVYFRQVGPVASGRPGLPNNGNLDIAVTDAAGNVIAGFGVNDATSDERVRIPAVAGQTYYLRVFANGAAINTYNVTVDNYVPPTPRDMELLDNPVGDPPPANSDTGRSQLDNITRDNTPTLVFRLDDGILLNDVQGNSPAGNNPPNGVVIPIPFQAAAGTAGYRIAIFDEGSSPAPGTQVGTAPQVPLGFATFVSPGVYQFTTPVLADGTHFLTARVQMVDPSAPQQTGFGERSVALEILVDTVIPTGFFGQTSLADTTQGLDAASDSGVVGYSATFVDRVTNDTTPTFYGRAEANTIVRVYAETNGVAGLQSSGAGADLFLGLTVAEALDGTNQFPGGQWSFTTPLDLNNPNLGFAHDGARSLYMTAEDVAGNVTTDAAADRLNIFLDTAGAQVTDVQITGSPLFNLFGLKPDNSIEGPTPRVDSLTIRVQDFPNRSNLDPNFLYAALQQAVATTPGNFVLKGDHSGIIAIQSITFIGDPTANGVIATGSILLNFFAPLPDDRYTLTIKENVVDPVGNKLDGESNAAEPIGNPSFASGDGQPGGDFVARFTVDSRPEIGSISEGLIYVDINGNMVWDPEGQDNDATNRDFTFQFGQLVDAHFSGNFAPVGAVAASGYDKLGAYGKFAGKYSFILDTNDDGVGDFSSLMPAAYQVNGMPVAGDFNAAHPGDEIGLFDGSFWYLDTNGNNQIDLGERFASNFNGLPVVGDFNGDGNDDLAVFVNDTNRFIFDTNRNGIADFTWNVADQLGRFGGLSGFTDRPVAGDLNLDGIDDIGLWTKDRQGTLPRNSGEFFFWVSDRPAPVPVPPGPPQNPANFFNSYSPAPLGNDLSAQFGDELALPVFGNFDPPVGTSTVDENPLHRKPAPLDINGDGNISPIDALLVINVLNKFQGLPTNDPVRAYFTIGQVKADSSGDRGVTPIDALLVINALNRKSNLGGAGEGEGEGADVEQYQAAADDFFAQLGDNSDLELLKKRRS
ncbi:MAG: dockerin type I domain-containing protein [Pirellulaceae bacterium]|nr:dockerin type I domain-containing protein [Pirellulaceae bacterium]